MKNLKKIAILALIFVSVSFFSACSSGKSSLMITANPSKIVYEINEKFDANGLNIESFNNDGTTTKIFLSDGDIEEVDTSTAGEKVVKVKKDNLSTTFLIYVANHVVTQASQIKQVITDSNEGDIIYIKKGEYKPESNQDESLYNILIDKKLTIIGDGSKDTIIHGNFVVGARDEGGDFLPLDNFEGFKLINIGMKLDYTKKDKYLTYEGPYLNYDIFGAIKTFNSSKIYISNCSFMGYSYAINLDNITNLTLVNNTFRDIKINAVKVTNNIKNSTISKNLFMDIATSSIAMENSKQASIGALYLSFNSKDNAGVIISNNIFTRIALMNGDFNYVTPGADELETQENISLTARSYVNNSSIIALVSSAENNLEVGGIIISMNNFGTTLKNIAFGTNETNIVNQTGVIINEA